MFNLWEQRHNCSRNCEHWRELVKWIPIGKVRKERSKSRNSVRASPHITFFNHWISSLYFRRISNLSSRHYTHYCTCYSYIMLYSCYFLKLQSLSFFTFPRFLGSFQPRRTRQASYCFFFSCLLFSSRSSHNVSSYFPLSLPLFPSSFIVYSLLSTKYPTNLRGRSRRY